MRPVMQTILHGDPDGRAGNCLQAAVASLFDLPLDAVPHFYEDCTPENHQHGWLRFEKWLETFGLYPREVLVDPRAPWAPSYLHIASGMSPRGVCHAVLHTGFQLTHDPHPDGGGVQVTDVIKLEVCDPLKLHRLEALRNESAYQEQTHAEQ